jgi:hypothetical protein
MQKRRAPAGQGACLCGGQRPLTAAYCRRGPVTGLRPSVVSVSCPVFAHKKPLRSGQSRRNGGVCGAPCRIRTDDPRFTRAVLWPTELRRHVCCTGYRPRMRACFRMLDKGSPRTPGGKNRPGPGRIRNRASSCRASCCCYCLASIAACTNCSNGVWALSPLPHCLPSTKTLGVPVMPATWASRVVCFT